LRDSKETPDQGPGNILEGIRVHETSDDDDTIRFKRNPNIPTIIYLNYYLLIDIRYLVHVVPSHSRFSFTSSSRIMSRNSMAIDKDIRIAIIGAGKQLLVITGRDRDLLGLMVL
jgi:hypothetical protein